MKDTLSHYFNQDGKLKQYPSKKPLRKKVLAQIASQFEMEKEYSEKEVKYWLANPQPVTEE